MRRVIIFLFAATLLTIDAFCQSNDALYIPVSINSPLFNRDDEGQIGVNINNYGFNYKIAGQIKSKILIFSLQQNSGQTKFDPFNFNNYYEQGEETHLIQSKPSEMFYCELGLGYNFQHKTQKIHLLVGAGKQIINPNTRLYIQVDWGNESRLINAGVSVRGNYTIVKDIELYTLEPLIQGKLKIWNFRVLSQFGYSIAMKRNEDYMKPILTFGIEYIIGKSAHSKGYSKLDNN